MAVKKGLSHRMRKQGIPEPLDESLVTRKRKDAPAAAVEERGKKRRTAKEAPKKVVAVNGSKHNVKAKSKAKPVKPVKKAAPPPVSDDEISDDSDARDDPDVMEDRGVVA